MKAEEKLPRGTEDIKGEDRRWDIHGGIYSVYTIYIYMSIFKFRNRLEKGM